MVEFLQFLEKWKNNGSMVSCEMAKAVIVKNSDELPILIPLIVSGKTSRRVVVSFFGIKPRNSFQGSHQAPIGANIQPV
jgi:hypothetical protein